MPINKFGKKLLKCIFLLHKLKTSWSVFFKIYIKFWISSIYRYTSTSLQKGNTIFRSPINALNINLSQFRIPFNDLNDLGFLYNTISHLICKKNIYIWYLLHQLSSQNYKQSNGDSLIKLSKFPINLNP